MHHTSLPAASSSAVAASEAPAHGPAGAATAPASAPASLPIAGSSDARLAVLPEAAPPRQASPSRAQAPAPAGAEGKAAPAGGPAALPATAPTQSESKLLCTLHAHLHLPAEQACFHSCPIAPCMNTADTEAAAQEPLHISGASQEHSQEHLRSHKSLASQEHLRSILRSISGATKA